MRCKHCGEPVVLVPSAASRAAKDSDPTHTAAWYRQLFPIHAACQLQQRAEQTSDLIHRSYT